MKYDYYCKDGNEMSTYAEDRSSCSFSNIKLNKQYNRIDQRVADAKDYKNLASEFRIEILDHDTGLRELVLDKIRAIHFLYLDDTFVFLGTFIKKTQKTPPRQIEINNNRLKEYLKQKNKTEE